MKNIILILFISFFSIPAFGDEKIILGMKVFNDKAMCGTCHKMQTADSNGDIGPNLDQLKPSLDRIIYVVKNGIGVMQSWEGILSNEEIEAVAYYVFNSTNK
tara:strand:- start:1469 stop:1774 length:306 start_codon:yes stop_codon:yes gene_type:complete